MGVVEKLRRLDARARGTSVGRIASGDITSSVTELHDQLADHAGRARQRIAAASEQLPAPAVAVARKGWWTTRVLLFALCMLFAAMSIPFAVVAFGHGPGPAFVGAVTLVIGVIVGALAVRYLLPRTHGMRGR